MISMIDVVKLMTNTCCQRVNIEKGKKRTKGKAKGNNEREKEKKVGGESSEPDD